MLANVKANAGDSIGGAVLLVQLPTAAVDGDATLASRDDKRLVTVVGQPESGAFPSRSHPACSACATRQPAIKKPCFCNQFAIGSVKLEQALILQSPGLCKA